MAQHYIRRFDLSKYTLKSFDSADEFCCDTNNSDFLTYDANGTNKVVVDTSSTQTLAAKTLTAPVVSGAAYTEVVAASGGTTRVLTAASSGSINLFDSASAGILYTLPAPALGLQYTFIVSVQQTGGALKIITDVSTTYLVGGIQMFSGTDVTPSSTLGPFNFTSALATTNLSVNMNATTTGGAVGSTINMLCISAAAGAGVWFVNGVILSPSGSLATPFATS